MGNIIPLKCGVTEFNKRRDPGGCEFVLLFDHNKRMFVAYDAVDEDFVFALEKWLDVPVDDYMCKDTAILLTIKSREALDSGSIIEFNYVISNQESKRARYIDARVIPDGPGMTMFHLIVRSEILLN